MDKPLLYAVTAAGGPVMAARACDVSRQAVDKWIANGYLPRTDYTGETNYAYRLAAAAGARGVAFTPSWLLTAAAPGASGGNAEEAGVGSEDLPSEREDRRRPEAQSSTRRRGRRVGDLSEAEFAERLARAREGAYPEEFTPPAIPKPSVE